MLVSMYSCCLERGIHMRIAFQYNYLNAREFLIVNRPSEFEEIRHSLSQIDANQYLKISCDKNKLGQVLYRQSDINSELKRILRRLNWGERKEYYYVTDDEQTTRALIHVHDRAQQRRIISEAHHDYYLTNNQIDFQKERIAVEVQFGKYFSVAYDLHVKHTFFFSRNDIDVGIEIIPTKAMEEHMDAGVSWYENEVTNVIREGRTNPPVPILILGIEPETFTSNEPTDYPDEALIDIIHHSDIKKLRGKIGEARSKNKMSALLRNRIARIEHCFTMMGIE